MALFPRLERYETRGTRMGFFLSSASDSELGRFQCLCRVNDGSELLM